MGARFDRWLARPSTLGFLRQLIGPEPVAVRTTRLSWTGSPGRYSKCYSTAQPALVTHSPEHITQDQGSLNAAAAASTKTSREQRERVAQELGLRIPQEDDGEHFHRYIGTTPSATSYSDLLYSEARVRDFSTARGLLIDEPVNHVNLEAWCKILQYRQRTDGFAGVMDVWAGMRKRAIDLPVDGPHADIFWTTFLKAAIYRKPDGLQKQLLRDVFEHAKRLKQEGSGHYRMFHKVFIGRFLRILPGDAKKPNRDRINNPECRWHQLACELGFCDSQALPFLVVDAVKSFNPRIAFERWKKLYHHDRRYYGNDKREMYDLCMPLVLLHVTNDAALVIAWHNFFSSNDEKPSPDLATNRSVNYLLGIESSSKAMLPSDHLQVKELTAILDEDRGGTRPPTSPLLSRAAMSSLVGEVHGIKPKAISDKFCARMFATQAFSLETSIRGLALLGTEALGPVALRELAIRAATPEILKERLADVKNAGIAILPSTYAHVLKTVVSDSQSNLLQTLLASDQHPESYDDQHTQETLLANFLQAEDWPLAHITLISLSRKDPRQTSRAWNRLLQHYTKTQNHKEVVRIFDHICSEQLVLTHRSLNFMMKYLLPARAPSKRPMESQTPRVARFVSINFVVNAHMYATLHGQIFTPDRWTELLKRYGMTGDMKGLERLVYWLVQRYPVRRSKSRNGRFRRLTAQLSMQAMVFQPVMLRAIIIWEFRSAVVRKELRPPTEESSVSAHEILSPESWTRGITILLHLKQLGLQIRTKDVRRAVTGILWTLFGPGVSTRSINVQLLRLNELTIMEYVQHANEAWETPLFRLPPGSEDTATEAQVLRAVFGSQRLADQKTGNWVDIDAWIAAKSEGSWHEAPPNLPDRRRTWSQSSFRFKDNFATRRQRQVANRRKDPFQSRQSGATQAQVTPQQNQQPAAPPLNWRPLPSQPSTQEEP